MSRLMSQLMNPRKIFIGFILRRLVRNLLIFLLIFAGTKGSNILLVLLKLMPNYCTYMKEDKLIIFIQRILTLLPEVAIISLKVFNLMKLFRF